MAAAEFTTPELKDHLDIPSLQRDAMAESKPYVASDKINTAIGFPGELVPDWEAKAIDRMGELLKKYRSLKVHLDACVHCGGCTA